MARMTARTTTTSPITLTLTARVAELVVHAVPGLTEATVDITGPADILDETVVEPTGPTWSIRIPTPATSTIGTTIAGGSVVFTSGTIQGPVVMSAGRTIIGGRLVEAGPLPDPIRVTVRIPAGSNLSVPHLDTGSAALTGLFGTIDFGGRNAPLLLAGSAREVRATTVNGAISLQGRTAQVHATTLNGTVRVERADGETVARTTNGNVVVAAAGPGRIDAQTVNGNVQVTGAQMYRVQVRAATLNGSRSVQ